MKVMCHIIQSLLLLGLLVACGKDNKSGQNNNQYAYNNGYSGYDAYGNPVFTGYNTNLSSPYSYNGYSVNTILAENTCVTYPNAGRMQVQVPLTGSQYNSITANDFYIGVTSYGDVGVVVGTGNGAMFVGYLCPRMSSSGQGFLSGIGIGSYSTCRMKPLVAATMQFPDGSKAAFRMLDYGSSRGVRFSVCQ